MRKAIVITTVLTTAMLFYVGVKMPPNVLKSQVRSTVIVPVTKPTKDPVDVVKKRLDEQETRLQRLEQENAKLKADNASMKDDRDNAISEKTRLKNQVRTMQQGINEYLSKEHKSLEYSYVDTSKESGYHRSGRFSYKLVPNRTDTVYVYIKEPNDTFRVSNGFLGLGSEKFTKYTRKQ